MTTLARLALVALVGPLAACLSPVVGAECAAGFTACGDACVDLQADLAHCGACFDDCGGACEAGVCRGDPNCDNPDGCPPDAGDRPDGAVPPDATPPPDALVCDPLLACDGTCVDPEVDPNHCGGCGVVCESGLCIDGDCLGSQPGHVIVIGHDYERPRLGMNRLVGNAVFLALGPTVDVLAYRGDATSAVVNGTRVAIDQVAAETGRAWTETAAATTAAIEAGLATTDVLLIDSQDGAGASDAELIQLGVDLEAELDGFLGRGGIVVLLDGEAAHGGTFQVLQAAGLFTAGGRTVVTGDVMAVVAPADAIASNVPSSYGGELTTVSFATADGTEVVEAPSGEPVVLHLVVP